VNELQRQLDARRRKLRLSYPQLARLTGMAQSTIWNIINGQMRQEPKYEQIELLAKALDWPIDHLRQMVGEQFKWHVYTVESKDLQVVMASWDELSERDRRTIVRMVEELRRNNDGGG
jgi:transcriptional regulator with XRE-family HTH domain